MEVQALADQAELLETEAVVLQVVVALQIMVHQVLVDPQDLVAQVEHLIMDHLEVRVHLDRVVLLEQQDHQEPVAHLVMVLQVPVVPLEVAVLQDHQVRLVTMGLVELLAPRDLVVVLVPQETTVPQALVVQQEVVELQAQAVTEVLVVLAHQGQAEPLVIMEVQEPVVMEAQVPVVLQAAVVLVDKVHLVPLVHQEMELQGLVEVVDHLVLQDLDLVEVRDPVEHQALVMMVVVEHQVVVEVLVLQDQVVRLVPVVVTVPQEHLELQVLVEQLALQVLVDQVALLDHRVLVAPLEMEAVVQVE